MESSCVIGSLPLTACHSASYAPTNAEGAIRATAGDFFRNHVIEIPARHDDVSVRKRESAIPARFFGVRAGVNVHRDRTNSLGRGDRQRSETAALPSSSRSQTTKAPDFGDASPFSFFHATEWSTSMGSFD
jgi:hypothetical protein